MKQIPLWGKIVGGCTLLIVLALIIGGCSVLAFVAGSDSPEPTSSPETSETTEPAPTEEDTPSPTVTEEEEPEVDTAGGINTCIPDQDRAMAEVVASVTSSDVTIYTDQVYVVAEDADLNSFYIVAGSDAGIILIYTTLDANGEPMAYAANQIAYDYTLLGYPEELGGQPIDTESETYKVAEGCVS